MDTLLSKSRFVVRRLFALEGFGVKAATLAAGIGLFSSPSYPQDDSRATTFRLRSDDKTYVALISAQKCEGASRCVDEASRLQVMKVIDAETKRYRPFWESSFTYSNALSGKLSEDGELLVTVSKFYEDSAIVWIYQKGAQMQQLAGADLKIDRAKLKAVSGRPTPWLAGTAYDSIKIENGDAGSDKRVIISALDGMTYTILVSAEALTFYSR